MPQKIDNFVDHVALVLDASTSMAHYRHVDPLIKVVDGLIGHLATKSKELERETRVSVFSFADTVKCLVWEKDVLRMPSIAGIYAADGNTALWDAIMASQADLDLIPQKYGDHGFLTYVLTDGEDNRSRNRAHDVQALLAGQAANRTVAMLVPNATAAYEAKRAGIPAGNVQVWDTQSRTGVEEAGHEILRSYDNYTVARTGGLKGSKNLFGGAATVNTATIQAAGLKPIDPKTYKLIPVTPPPGFVKDVDVIEIGPFVRSINNNSYKVGSVYYPVLPALKRNPRIGPEKGIVILNKATNMAYTGPGVRTLLGLPEDGMVTVKPDANPEYTVYVESTSSNRHLTPHSKILMFT